MAILYLAFHFSFYQLCKSKLCMHLQLLNLIPIVHIKDGSLKAMQLSYMQAQISWLMSACIP